MLTRGNFGANPFPATSRPDRRDGTEDGHLRRRVGPKHLAAGWFGAQDTPSVVDEGRYYASAVPVRATIEVTTKVLN